MSKSRAIKAVQPWIFKALLRVPMKVFTSDQINSVSAADVLWGDDLSLFLSGSYDRASGQVVGPSKEAAGALLYGGDGRIREEILLGVWGFEVVQEVGLTVLEGDAGQMASGHDPGG
ncbi:hypothetical protein DFAR_2480009 [Desulfarculales bacterium]